MVKFYESHFSYEYAFPTVTLAYFLRYPNPYSRHVLSTDVIDRYVDPKTQRLHTVRLHLKRSKVPSAILKILPRSFVGSLKGNAGQSYILEKSVIDLQEGWMSTETKNLEWTGVLSVVERQKYSRPSLVDRVALRTPAGDSPQPSSREEEAHTDVMTTVMLRSRLGQARTLASKHMRTGPKSNGQALDDEDEPPVTRGFFSPWSMSSIQKSVEIIGIRRSRDHLMKSKEGMQLVLERLRNGGLGCVLEGMRRDATLPHGGNGPWSRT